jgi:hypothetical protein
MGWDKHGTRRYYTRSHKKDGKVTRVYFGNGAEAELAAALDKSRRERKQAERQALQADRKRWDDACDTLDSLIAFSDLLVEAKLLAEGFHQHDRGQWRRRRDHAQEC